MKYLCLIYRDETAFDSLAPEDRDAAEKEWARHCAALQTNGRLLVAERLQAPVSAVSIHMQSGNPVLTDGSLDEGRKKLDGFFLLDARDLNDAIRIAEKFLPARLSCIEVRPVLEQHAENFSVPMSIC